MNKRAARIRQMTVTALSVGGAAIAALFSCQVAGDMPPAYIFHAGLMFYAWGVLLPAGSIIARYFKVTRDQDFPRERDNRFWWNSHRALQSGGVALATAAVLIMTKAGGGLSTLHSQFGIAAVGLAWLQVFSSLLRGTMGGPTDVTTRGDHYDMTMRRRLFELFHKSCGWITLCVAAVSLLLGAALVGASGSIMAMLGCIVAIWLSVVSGLARSGRWVDTHAAIWGRDSGRLADQQTEGDQFAAKTQ